MGFALLEGLNPEAYDRVYSDRQLLRRITHTFRAQTSRLVKITILLVLTSALDALTPFLISQGIDLWATTNVIPLLLLMVSFILFSATLSWLIHYFREVITARAVEDIGVQLRQDAFQAVMARDMSFFDEFPSGSIVSRVTSDTKSFASVITLALEFFSQVLLFVAVAAILFLRNVQLALLTLLVMPVIFAVSLGFRRVGRRLIQRSQRSLGRLNINIQEILQGIMITKIYRQEQRMYNEFLRINQQAYHVNLRSDFFYKAILPVLTLVSNLGLAIVIYFGGLDVLNHSMTAGDWFLFVQCLGLLWIPLTSIASFGSQFQVGLAACERVFALLDAEPGVRQTGQQPVQHLQGKIEFAHVSFRYNRRQPVLVDFSLTIQAGETVALVGHTGAGKSSLGKLIARFYEFQEGQLLIDNRDIRALDLHDYHHHLGIIPQIPFLFSGTVAENIRYGSPLASREKIEEAVKRVGGGDWLKTLPQGLETSVGEGGKCLSSGQRQLISFARVLLQDPEIVILDEATASIDPITEAHIQECLDVLLQGRTAIIIAHRLSTIRSADRILVLEHGRVMEEGNHNTLIQTGGEYATLYNTYFRHQSSDYQPGAGFVPGHALE
jgi:ABC-type multidrug transport system fused ATPase/permease subunit